MSINYAHNQDEFKRGAVIGALLLLALTFAFSMSGCATANTIKKQIAGDLQVIAQQDDCETSCMLLKAYIKEKLSGL